MNKIIFDLTREDWDYKGIFFGEIDNAAVDKEMNSPFPTSKDFLAGMMAIIWIDENKIWHLTARIKFPSGSKQVIRRTYDEEAKKGFKINETFVLSELYKMPMINKKWTPNPSGKACDIVEIIKKLGMIESIRTEKKDANEE